MKELQRFFEYVAFAVMVRNGDGHLKNFGLLYEHPAAVDSIRLAPLYDVVTTSVYGSTSLRTGITKYDRTLALNLAKSKNYPDRATLLDFGARVCAVTHPERVLERIADAMTAALSEHQERIDPPTARSDAYGVGGRRRLCNAAADAIDMSHSGLLWCAAEEFGGHTALEGGHGPRLTDPASALSAARWISADSRPIAGWPASWPARNMVP